MRLILAAAAIVLCAGAPGFAHRLDEYHQATMFSVEKDRIEAEMRLTPGVAVFPLVLASIDADADGRISDAEQSAYAERVLRDLSLMIDNDRLRLTLVSVKFATIEEMREGRGEIQLAFRASVPPGGPNRRLTFKNHHQIGMAAWLVNSLVPRDPKIRLLAQKRNQDQSVYQLDYVQDELSSSLFSLSRWSGAHLWTGTALLLLLARLAWVWRRTASRARSSATLLCGTGGASAPMRRS